MTSKMVLDTPYTPAVQCGNRLLLGLPYVLLHSLHAQNAGAGRRTPSSANSPFRSSHFIQSLRPATMARAAVKPALYSRPMTVSWKLRASVKRSCAVGPLTRAPRSMWGLGPVDRKAGLLLIGLAHGCMLLGHDAAGEGMRVGGLLPMPTTKLLPVLPRMYCS
jgi:hypothetical protein